MHLPYSASILLALVCSISDVVARSDKARFKRSQPSIEDLPVQRRDALPPVPTASGTSKTVTLTAVGKGLPFDNHAIIARSSRFFITPDTKVLNTGSYCALQQSNPASCPDGTQTVIKVANQHATMNSEILQQVYIALPPKAGGTTAQHSPVYGNLSFTIAHEANNPSLSLTVKGKTWRADTGFAFAPGAPSDQQPAKYKRQPQQNGGEPSSTSTASAAAATGSGSVGTLQYNGLKQWIACPAPWFDEESGVDTQGKVWNVIADTADVTFDVEKSGCKRFFVRANVVELTGESAWQYQRVGSRKERRGRMEVEGEEEEEEQ